MRCVVFLSLVLLLCSCASKQPLGIAGDFPPPTGSGGVYKVGNPYSIDGITYYPREDWNYSEVGQASWYGSEFHGRLTANGETFDKMTMTAAHRTLPMPSIVRVTNLENDKSVILRVNDRGPFARNRIIDVSKLGAQKLGFERQGTARVRVELLQAETRSAIAQMRGAPAHILVADTAVNPINRKVLVESTMPATVPVINPGQSIYIQTGAFGLRENADKVVQQLQAIHSTVVSPTMINDKPLYRVRVGPFESVDVADRYLAEVRASGYNDARVVID
jgi:rare lipoprotein A